MIPPQIKTNLEKISSQSFSDNRSVVTMLDQLEPKRNNLCDIDINKSSLKKIQEYIVSKDSISDANTTFRVFELITNIAKSDKVNPDTRKLAQTLFEKHFDTFNTRNTKEKEKIAKEISQETQFKAHVNRLLFHYYSNSKHKFTKENFDEFSKKYLLDYDKNLHDSEKRHAYFIAFLKAMPFMPKINETEEDENAYWNVKTVFYTIIYHEVNHWPMDKQKKFDTEIAPYVYDHLLNIKSIKLILESQQYTEFIPFYLWEIFNKYSILEKLVTEKLSKDDIYQLFKLILLDPYADDFMLVTDVPPKDDFMTLFRQTVDATLREKINQGRGYIKWTFHGNRITPEDTHEIFLSKILQYSNPRQIFNTIVEVYRNLYTIKNTLYC